VRLHLLRELLQLRLAQQVLTIISVQNSSQAAVRA
jgi:hypothetical protein